MSHISQKNIKLTRIQTKFLTFYTLKTVDIFSNVINITKITICKSNLFVKIHFVFAIESQHQSLLDFENL